MKAISSNAVSFGNIYHTYSPEAAQQKQNELEKRGIESAVQPQEEGCFGMKWVVYTDEDGTKDLTNYKKRLDRNA